MTNHYRGDVLGDNIMSPFFIEVWYNGRKADGSINDNFKCIECNANNLYMFAIGDSDSPGSHNLCSKCYLEAYRKLQSIILEDCKNATDNDQSDEPD